MSPEQMRHALYDAYPFGPWKEKVDKMSERQVAATYLRLLNANKL